MKIAFIGSHSTGKTTILNELKKIYPYKNYISEMVRELKKKYKITINEQTTMKNQLVFFNECLKILLLEKEFISDRSILDVYAYTEYIYLRDQYDIINNKFKVNNNDKYIIEYMVSCIIKYMKLYDKIFYFPIEFNLVKDDIRSNNEKYRLEIDQIINDCLKEFKISFIIVKGSIEERIKIIKKELN